MPLAWRELACQARTSDRKQCMDVSNLMTAPVSLGVTSAAMAGTRRVESGLLSGSVATSHRCRVMGRSIFTWGRCAAPSAAGGGTLGPENAMADTRRPRHPALAGLASVWNLSPGSALQRVAWAVRAGAGVAASSAYWRLATACMRAEGAE